MLVDIYGKSIDAVVFKYNGKSARAATAKNCQYVDATGKVLARGVYKIARWIENEDGFCKTDGIMPALYSFPSSVVDVHHEMPSRVHLALKTPSNAVEIEFEYILFSENSLRIDDFYFFKPSIVSVVCAERAIQKRIDEWRSSKPR